MGKSVKEAISLLFYISLYLSQMEKLPTTHLLNGVMVFRPGSNKMDQVIEALFVVVPSFSVSMLTGPLLCMVTDIIPMSGLAMMAFPSM